METPRRDPLLVAAKVATIIVRIFLVIGMVALGIAMTVSVLGGAGLMPDEIRVEIGDALSGAPAWVAVLALFASLVALGLMYDFVVRLAHIIDTVGEGDPFTLVNSARLTRMAWLALSVEALALASSLLDAWGSSPFGDEAFGIESDFSLTGLALALVLFILARVFREGARMRDDLEGTV